MTGNDCALCTITWCIKGDLCGTQPDTKPKSHKHTFRNGVDEVGLYAVCECGEKKYKHPPQDLNTLDDELDKILDDLAGFAFREGGHMISGMHVGYNDKLEEAKTHLTQLLAKEREKAHRTGYAAGNAKKNYRKKVDGEAYGELYTALRKDVTEDVLDRLTTIKSQLEGKKG